VRILRSLIDKIVLTPRDDGQHLSVDLIGDLAGILSIATRKDRPVVEKELLKLQSVMGNDGRKHDAEKDKSQENWAILAMVAGAGFRRQDYADIEIKDIFGSSQTAAAGVYPVRRFIHMAWDIGPEAAAA
jgi:hypothetical protein